MYKSIQIFVPTEVKTTKKVFLKGVITTNLYQILTIYFTEFSGSVDDIVKDNNSIIGYVSNPNEETKFRCSGNHLEFNSNRNSVSKLVIGSKIIDKPNKKSVLIYYDHKAVKYSENISVDNFKDKFSLLHKLVKNEEICDKLNTDSNSSLIVKPVWMSMTMWGQHVIRYFDLMKWLKNNMKNERKISIKQGNMIIAIIIDIILGYFAIQLFAQNKIILGKTLMQAVEAMVKYLFSLLEWLMGAPAGLKLNNAFNKMLGKFFSYHIQLWWHFLEVIGSKLDIILEIFHWLGYLGFTFQAALVSDIFCAVTFHSYCIYVYAARLFNIQISGLIALTRLFVGRKYNPLRGGIDSCEYTNQELFVGTVAFTILLFLLPTTTLYYIVFTLFRLLSLAVQYILTKLIYFIQTLPLYVTFLWMIKSPKVAGSVHINIIKDVEKEPLILKLKVTTKPLRSLLASTKPPVESQNPIQWSNLLSNLLRGKLIT